MTTPTPRKGADDAHWLMSDVQTILLIPATTSQIPKDTRLHLYEIGMGMKQLISDLAAREAELADVRNELDAVLRDWNALVRAIGSPTNGAAIGYAANLKQRAEAAEDRDTVSRDALDYLYGLTPERVAQLRAAERELASVKAENSKLRSALEIVHFKQEPWQ